MSDPYHSQVYTDSKYYLSSQFSNHSHDYFLIDEALIVYILIMGIGVAVCLKFANMCLYICNTIYTTQEEEEEENVRSTEDNVSEDSNYDEESYVPPEQLEVAVPATICNIPVNNTSNTKPHRGYIEPIVENENSEDENSEDLPTYCELHSNK